MSLHQKTKYLIGIDEAGRGPLAGPVSVGAVMISKDFNKKLWKGVRDSKKLSHKAREEWFIKLQEWQKLGIIKFHVALVSEKIIDTKGISYAIKKGIAECLKKVKADCDTCTVLLDGSLKAPAEFLNQETIIKGDDKEPIISLASIAAKVTRDRYIIKIAKKYPLYKLEIHKGYGTHFHREMIKKYGSAVIHRKSFLRNIR